MVHLFLGYAVVGPSLNAGEMQEAEAVLARPYRLIASDSGDTDETRCRIRLELIFQSMLCFRQILCVPRVRFNYGLDEFGDLNFRLVLLFTGLVGSRVHDGVVHTNRDTTRARPPRIPKT